LVSGFSLFPNMPLSVHFNPLPTSFSIALSLTFFSFLPPSRRKSSFQEIARQTEGANDDLRARRHVSFFFLTLLSPLASSFRGVFILWQPPFNWFSTANGRVTNLPLVLRFLLFLPPATSFAAHAVVLLALPLRLAPHSLLSLIRKVRDERVHSLLFHFFFCGLKRAFVWLGPLHFSSEASRRIGQPPPPASIRTP